MNERYCTAPPVRRYQNPTFDQSADRFTRDIHSDSFRHIRVAFFPKMYNAQIHRPFTWYGSLEFRRVAHGPSHDTPFLINRSFYELEISAVICLVGNFPGWFLFMPILFRRQEDRPTNFHSVVSRYSEWPTNYTERVIYANSLQQLFQFQIDTTNQTRTRVHQSRVQLQQRRSSLDSLHGIFPVSYAPNTDQRYLSCQKNTNLQWGCFDSMVYKMFTDR